jgi:apolipoprotein N-acyltransferase
MTWLTRERWTWAVLLLAGYTQALAVAWPWQMGAWISKGQALGVLQIVAMATAVAVISQSTHARAAALKAGVFTTTWLSTSFAWLYVSMHQYGGLPAWAAASAVVLLAAALALYYAAASAVYWRWRGERPLAAAWLFAATWTMAELARGQWLTGFPWGAIGYAHVNEWAGWMPWLGVYGVGAVAAFLSAGLALGLIRRSYRTAIWVVILALGMGLWSPGKDNTQSTGALRVWLLQGNIDQDQKFNNDTGIRQALQWYPDQWRASTQAEQRPDLVVAPETAVPVLPQHIHPEHWRQWLEPLATQATSADGRRVHWMTGVPMGSSASGYTNSAWGIDEKNAQSPTPWEVGYRYDKHHLVPMGEFIPPFFRWFTEWMNIPLGDFNRGPLVQAPWSVNGQQVSAHICFEDVFGEEMAQSVAKTDATVLVNLSNLAWFGGSIALDQHLNIARVRAMELGRPIVRATNTGATAHIDHQGVVVARMPHRVQGRLEVEVDGRTGQTPYVAWVSTTGLLPLWALALLVVAWAVWRRSRAVTSGS